MAVRKQVPRRIIHARVKKAAKKNPRLFNYDLNYKNLDIRKQPELYRVGRGEQGVLLVEPYKSEILPSWKFKTPADAKKSAVMIRKIFIQYKRKKDFVGMDMARKFMQMGFTRSRRYANHAAGRKYAKDGSLLPFKNDKLKAESAAIFKTAWEKLEVDPTYRKMKVEWKERFG